MSTSDQNHQAVVPVRRKRMGQAERMREIANAAAELFAERGFHATGSRDLARASGVSEGLIFRYFVDKESLWRAALDTCRENAVADSLSTLRDRPPSTRALVALTRELAEDFIRDEPGARTRNRNNIHRMMLRSLAEDGDFARMVLADRAAILTSYLADCIRAAEQAGDAELDPDESEISIGLFFRLLFFVVGTQRLARPPVADFGTTDEQLIQNLIRYQLRALGLRKEAIDRELGPSKGSKRRSRRR